MRNQFCFLMATLPALLIVQAANSPTAFSDDAGGDPVRVDGVGVSPRDWDVNDLREQFSPELAEIQFSARGSMHRYQCVPLLSLLKKSGAPAAFKMQPAADPKVKSYPLRLAVVVHGRDGYVVAFAMAELLPDFGNKAVWVAITEDGKPIANKEGPIRLISPDDKLPARCVHQVSEISVVDANQQAPATTQP